MSPRTQEASLRSLGVGGTPHVRPSVVEQRGAHHCRARRPPAPLTRFLVSWACNHTRRLHPEIPPHEQQLSPGRPGEITQSPGGRTSRTQGRTLLVCSATRASLPKSAPLRGSSSVRGWGLRPSTGSGSDAYALRTRQSSAQHSHSS